MVNSPENVYSESHTKLTSSPTSEININITKSTSQEVPEAKSKHNISNITK